MSIIGGVNAWGVIYGIILGEKEKCCSTVYLKKLYIELYHIIYT